MTVSLGSTHVGQYHQGAVARFGLADFSACPWSMILAPFRAHSLVFHDGDVVMSTPLIQHTVDGCLGVVPTPRVSLS